MEDTVMLAKLLKEKNISPYRLSKISGIPYTTLSDIIGGRTLISTVSASTLARLAKALGISMDELYYGREIFEPIFMYNEGRYIHIVYEDLHFKFMGPKNLIAFKNVNRITEGCAHVNAYYRDKKVIYLEEEYIDIKGEFAAYEQENRFPERIDLRLEKPGEKTDRYTDEALMICDNMAVLKHDSSTDSVEIEIVNMTRQSSRMMMRLEDYAVLSSSMSDTMQKRATAMVKRNADLIAELSDERGNSYA